MTAGTRLAEAGQPDWVIQAQIGHASPAMMKTYSHIRRKALDEAAAVLEPTFEFAPTAPTAPEASAETRIEVAEEVTSQVASQSGDLDAELTEILKEFGSPHWTISATGSSEKLRKSAFFRQTRQSFANHAAGSVDTARQVDMPQDAAQTRWDSGSTDTTST
jgi:hypothetical protein